MPVEMLTYAALGERLKISPEAARALVKRHRLPRSRSNDGKTLVQVDLTEISHSPVCRPQAPAGHQVVTSLKEKIETLQAELIEMQAIAGGHRADFERECERTNKLLAELLKASTEQLIEMQAIAGGHRADFERECERSNKLLAELLKASTETVAAREKAALLEGKLSALMQPWRRRLVDAFSLRRQPPTCVRASDALPDRTPQAQ
jgi:hypothetical protein